MKKILTHFAIILLAGFLILFIALRSLRIYTKHDKELVMVPEVLGLKSHEAIEELEKMGLKYSIMDTVYKDGERKLAVINQNPHGGLKVKNGRTIYLVINSDKIPMVEIPDLSGKTSLNQATSILSRSGLRLGDVIERPSEMVKSRSNKPVLGQRLHGDSSELIPGGLIERNTIIDLIIGVPINTRDSLNYQETNPEETEPIELF